MHRALRTSTIFTVVALVSDAFAVYGAWATGNFGTKDELQARVQIKDRCEA